MNFSFHPFVARFIFVYWSAVYSDQRVVHEQHTFHMQVSSIQGNHALFQMWPRLFLRINWVRETNAWYGVGITWKQLTENIVTNYIRKHENTLYFFTGYWHWLCRCCVPKVLFPFCHSCPNVSLFVAVRLVLHRRKSSHNWICNRSITWTHERAYAERDCLEFVTTFEQGVTGMLFQKRQYWGGGGGGETLCVRHVPSLFLAGDLAPVVY
jgi:hypothetical protein